MDAHRTNIYDSDVLDVLIESLRDGNIYFAVYFAVFLWMCLSVCIIYYINIYRIYVPEEQHCTFIFLAPPARDSSDKIKCRTVSNGAECAHHAPAP